MDILVIGLTRRQRSAIHVLLHSWTSYCKAIRAVHDRAENGNRERESEAAQETSGAAIWRLKPRGFVTPDDNLRGWPTIEMPGEFLQTAYAPVGAKGNDDDENFCGHGVTRPSLFSITLVSAVHLWCIPLLIEIIINIKCLPFTQGSHITTRMTADNLQ